MEKHVLTVLAVACTTAAMAQIPTNGLVAHYPLDGDGNDISGNGYHGVTITATPTEDRFGNPTGAYHFDGSQYIEVPHTAPFNLTSVTVSAWIRTSEAPGYYRTVAGIAHNSWGMGGYAWGLMVHYGQPVVYTGSQAMGPDAVNDGNWHHLVGVVDNENMLHHLYVDGQLVQSASGGAGSPASGLFQLGRFRYTGGGGDSYFTGDIDDVTIFDRALTPNEIANIHTPCTPISVSNPQSICAGQSYSINGNTYTVADMYVDVLVASNGCDSIVTTQLTVNPLPEIDVTASNISICEGQSTQLTATGANVFQWDNSLGSGDEHTVTPSQSTTYTAYGIGGNGCQASASVLVTVTPFPTIDIAASPSEICLGELVDLSASGAVEFEWDNGLGAGAEHTLNPQETATYTVTGTTSGCQSTASVLVTVNPIPEVTAQSDNLIICEGESTLLEASGSTVEEWLWMGGISTEATVTVSPAESTTFTVFGTDANGCVGYDEITVEVNTCVGLSDGPATEEMRVWADGARNTVHYANVPTSSVLTVTDMMGRVVCSEQVKGSSGQVALQVPSGTYLIQITDGTTKTHRKVVFGK